MDKGKQGPVVDQNADLFSRITAYKEKIKEIENKQKGMIVDEIVI